MKKKSSFKQRVIPEFFFPQTIQIIKETEDSNFLFASGSYPPQIKCFELEKLTLKFKRHLDFEIKDFQILTKNWEKVVFLRQDKYLEFHSKSGCHYQLKLKSPAVNLAFDRSRNILFCTSNTNEILRLDLLEGKFLGPIITKSGVNFSCSEINPISNIIGVGTSSGYTQFWDPRVLKKPVCVMSNFPSPDSPKNRVTTIHFNSQIEHLCYTGHSRGETVIWDLRLLGPVLAKKNKNKTPIKKIKSNFREKVILSSDYKSINLWDEKSGKTRDKIEPSAKINDVCHIKDTGFFFIATENPFPESRFFQSLGEIPFWAIDCILKNKKAEKNFQKLKKKLFVKKP